MSIQSTGLSGEELTLAPPVMYQNLSTHQTLLTKTKPPRRWGLCQALLRLGEVKVSALFM
jgi:hypothetical protein